MLTLLYNNLKMAQNQAKTDGCYSNGQNYVRMNEKDDDDEKTESAEKERIVKDVGGEEAQVIGQQVENLEPGQKQDQKVQLEQTEQLGGGQTEQLLGGGQTEQLLGGGQTEQLLGGQTEQVQGSLGNYPLKA